MLSSGCNEVRHPCWTQRKGLLKPVNQRSPMLKGGGREKKALAPTDTAACQQCGTGKKHKDPPQQSLLLAERYVKFCNGCLAFRSNQRVAETQPDA